MNFNTRTFEGHRFDLTVEMLGSAILVRRNNKLNPATDDSWQGELNYQVKLQKNSERSRVSFHFKEINADVAIITFTGLDGNQLGDATRELYRFVTNAAEAFTESDKTAQAKAGAHVPRQTAMAGNAVFTEP